MAQEGGQFACQSMEVKLTDNSGEAGLNEFGAVFII
jgi:hypothetical protein